MITKNDIINVIAQKQSSADFCIGDILINLSSLTIDHIKIEPAFIRVCCEDSKEIEKEIIQAVCLINDMIDNNEIILGKTTERIEFGNKEHQMRLRSEPIHCDRHFPGLNIIGRDRLVTICYLSTQD